jgi:PLP dependent protein
MSSIEQNLNQIKDIIPEGVTLVAVSKTKPVNDILIAYKKGQRIFGENRIQELLAKKDMLPSDIKWHLIGHLQSNKVKFIVPFISLIQSVDTFKLLKTINMEAEKSNKVVDCLLQVYIASEKTKFGFSPDEVLSMIQSIEFAATKNIRICGLMGMATFTEDQNLIRNEFRKLKGLYDNLKVNFFSSDIYFREISMGMSGDYRIAIEEGSTMVRLGSLIFGER